MYSDIIPGASRGLPADTECLFEVHTAVMLHMYQDISPNAFRGFSIFNKHTQCFQGVLKFKQICSSVSIKLWYRHPQIVCLRCTVQCFQGVIQLDLNKYGRCSSVSIKLWYRHPQIVGLRCTLQWCKLLPQAFPITHVSRHHTQCFQGFVQFYWWY
jgi:hypothetical protein